jgi:hypothetical protein
MECNDIGWGSEEREVGPAFSLSLPAHDRSQVQRDTIELLIEMYIPVLLINETPYLFWATHANLLKDFSLATESPEC